MACRPRRRHGWEVEARRALRATPSLRREKAPHALQPLPHAPASRWQTARQIRRPRHGTARHRAGWHHSGSAFMTSVL